MNDFKKLTRRQLFECLPHDFRFKNPPPWKHQLVSIVQILRCTGYNIWLDLGLGKSRVAIDVVRFVHQYYKPKIRAFVVCLNETAMGNWEEQVKKHSTMDVVRLLGNFDEKVSSCQALRAGFYIVNYPGLQVMYSDLKDDTRKRKKGKKRRVINKSNLHLFGNWDVIILDEAHKLRNPDSLTYEICKRLVDKPGVVSKLLLTGTPFVELLDLWGQYYIVDNGETFGSNFVQFRKAHCVDVGFWGPKWKPTKAGAARIKAKMFDKAVRYEESEAKQLPPKFYTKLEYELAEEQREYYERLINKFPVNLKGTNFEFKNSAIGFREICGGFLMHRFSEQSSNVKIFDVNPKLNDLLLPLVESVVDVTKVVIFHDFVVEGRLIEQALKKLKIGFASLRGEVKDKYGEYTRFRKDPKVRVLVAHPQSGGASLEFVEATYCIFYSNVHGKVIDRQQCEKRVHRPGQTRRTFFYDLIGKHTIEESIILDLKSKQKAVKRAMNYNSFIKMLRGEK